MSQLLRGYDSGNAQLRLSYSDFHLLLCGHGGGIWRALHRLRPTPFGHDPDSDRIRSARG